MHANKEQEERGNCDIRAYLKTKNVRGRIETILRIKHLTVDTTRPFGNAQCVASAHVSDMITIHDISLVLDASSQSGRGLRRPRLLRRSDSQPGLLSRLIAFVDEVLGVGTSRRPVPLEPRTLVSSHHSALPNPPASHGALQLTVDLPEW